MVALELEIRKKIYDCIDASPGLHFREIQRRVGIAVGSLDYHLHYLHRRGLIRPEKEQKITRYYPMTKNWGEEEKQIISLLRQKNIRHILIYLLRHKKARPNEIVSSLGISRSTLSWYLKNLAGKGIIEYSKKGRFRTYRIKEPDKIINYLIVYRKSFLDDLVDNFIDTWGEK